MKKFCSILVSALMLISTVPVFQNTVSAKTLNKQPIGTILKVGKYKGVIISYKDLPKNIKPKIVNNINDGAKILDDAEKSMKLAPVKNIDLNNHSNSILPAVSGGRQDVINGGPQPGTYFHVVVNYTHNGSRFIHLSSLSSYLSGPTSGDVSWNQTDYDWGIINGGQTLSTDVYGVLSDYVITPAGLVKVWDSTEKVGTHFSA